MYDFTPVARYMEDVVCTKHSTPGCDILVYRDHQPLFRHICGVSDYEGKQPVGEFGWDGAAGAYVMMDDVNRLSIAFSMHVLGWPNSIGNDHAALRDIVYDVLEV